MNLCGDGVVLAQTMLHDLKARVMPLYGGQPWGRRMGVQASVNLR